VVDFQVQDGSGNVESAARSTDRGVGGQFTITFNFPDGTSKQVTIRGRERVTFNWS
jgi:hypothetical protein